MINYDTLMRAPSLDMSDEQYARKADDIIRALFQHPLLSRLRCEMSAPELEPGEKMVGNISVHNAERRAIIVFRATDPADKDTGGRFDGASLRFAVKDDGRISAAGAIGLGSDNVFVLSPRATEAEYAASFSNFARRVSRKVPPDEGIIILRR